MGLGGGIIFKLIMIEDQLGVLMAAPAQGHEKKPSLELTRVPAHQHHSSAKVDLIRLTGRKIQMLRCLGCIDSQGTNETVNRGVTATEVVIARQRLADGFTLDTLLSPIGHNVARPRSRQYLTVA